VNPADKLLQLLKRPDVSEIVLASGRPPLAKVAGAHRALSQTSLSTDDILRMIAPMATMPPSAWFEKPAKWNAETAVAGTVEITALQRADVLQVRFITAPAAAAPAPRPAPAARPEPARPAAPRAPAAEPDSSPSIPGAREIELEPGDSDSSLELAREPGTSAQPWQGEATMEAADAVGGGFELDSGSYAEDRQLTPSPEAGPRASVGGGTRASGSLAALLEEARSLNASDLHVVAERPPLFRIAGQLAPRDHAVLSAAEVETMCQSIVPTRLKARFEKEGSCDFSLDQDGSRYRVNIVQQRTGLKACLRIIGREVPTFRSLGLPSSIAKATEHHQGLIVVTGPSGSGKTSTLAAIVNHINENTSHHVLTVEDPVEYVHPRKNAVISQREVGTHTKTFASALKGSLREDPDVIVVGELRDTETVRMAISASETGHLVIATMNTPNAAKTIDRLIDLFPPADQAQVRMSLSTGLRLIISQRLVPSTDEKSLHVACELLPGSVALGNLIRDEKTYQIPSLQQRGKSMGIVRLDDSLLELIRLGRTTLELALPHAQSPNELAAAPLNVAPVMNAASGSHPAVSRPAGLFGRK